MIVPQGKAMVALTKGNPYKLHTNVILCESLYETHGTRGRVYIQWKLKESEIFYLLFLSLKPNSRIKWWVFTIETTNSSLLIVSFVWSESLHLKKYKFRKNQLLENYQSLMWAWAIWANRFKSCIFKPFMMSTICVLLFDDIFKNAVKFIQKKLSHHKHWLIPSSYRIIKKGFLNYRSI